MVSAHRLVFERPKQPMTPARRESAEKHDATNDSDPRIGEAVPIERRAKDVMKPSIVHILDGRSAGDAEALTRLLVSQLTHTYRFSCISIGGPGDLDAALSRSGIAVHIVERRPGLDWRCSRRLATLLQREKAALVHAHQSSAQFYAMLSRLHYQHPAILFTEHERPHPDLPSPRRASIYKLFLEKRDRVVAVSRSVRQALVMNEGLPPEQVEVVYPGVATPEAQGEGNVRAIRRELGVQPQELMILQSAPFTLRQNHAIAIQAMEQVVRRLPGARLVLVGDGPELETIRSMISRSHLDASIHVLGPRSDIESFMRAADLVLSTSMGNTIPPALIQALAAGRPVVATRAPAVAEIIEDRVCGLLAGPDDYGTLAAHIIRLGTRPGLRESFGQRGRERAAKLFTQAETSVSYATIYHAMLSL